MLCYCVLYVGVMDMVFYFVLIFYGWDFEVESIGLVGMLVWYYGMYEMYEMYEMSEMYEMY